MSKNVRISTRCEPVDFTYAVDGDEYQYDFYVVSTIKFNNTSSASGNFTWDFGEAHGQVIGVGELEVEGDGGVVELHDFGGRRSHGEHPYLNVQVGLSEPAPTLYYAQRGGNIKALKLLESIPEGTKVLPYDMGVQSGATVFMPSASEKPVNVRTSVPSS